MALNPTLTRWAGGGIAALGVYAKYLPYSEECQDAIKTGVDIMIRITCGPRFGNDDLILIVIMGGVGVILISFWKDIAQAIYDKANSETI
jgi:hypothetical protein